MATAGRVGPDGLGLAAPQLEDMYYKMLLARLVDERMWVLNRQGKVPFVISCQGHEAAQVGAAYALDRDKDWLLPYYRDAAAVLVWGMTARDLMLSLFAKAEDPNSGGRQMPGHFGSHRLRIVSQSSPVATQVVHAAGVALAAKMRGEDSVAFTTLGEGATNQGDFHEGLNFMGVQRLPVVVMVESNGYAISVPHEKQLPIENVADRAQAYGFPGVTVDGNDPLAVYEVVRAAANRARRGEGPTLIEAKTYRLVPHSSDDDDRTYRSREEVEKWRRRDPIPNFRAYLLENGIAAEERLEELRRQAEAEVDAATDYAEGAAYPDPATALDHVYAEVAE